MRKADHNNCQQLKQATTLNIEVRFSKKKLSLSKKMLKIKNYVQMPPIFSFRYDFNQLSVHKYERIKYIMLKLKSTNHIEAI